MLVATQSESEAAERGALDFVNAIRDELNLHPLAGLKRGRRCESDDCPIANSITSGLSAGVGVGVADTFIEMWDGFDTHLIRKVPASAQRFVFLFDHQLGSFEHLDLELVA